MAGLQFADIPGAISRGLQLRQQQQLAPLQQQSAELGLQRQQQQFETGGLQQQNLQQQIDQRTDEQKSISLVNTALRVKGLRDEEIAPFLKSQVDFIKSKGGDPAESVRALALAESGDFATVRKGAENLVNIGVRQGLIKPETVAEQEKGFTLGSGQQRFDAQGNLIASGVAPAKKLSSIQQKVEAEGIDPFSEAGQARAREINLGSRTDPSLKVEAAVIPEVLLTGLSDEVAAKSSAAFSSAGGGKDGLKAFQEIVDKGTEQERRITSPKILKASFPKASQAELTQLQATMDSAKTTQEGLKLAGKLRVEQRRDKKGKVFQDRAVELLTGILSNDELDDVLGSIEGSVDFRLQDSEAELIADIEEAGNILTADNLSLMSGVLSETDIKILKNLAGGGLIRTRSLERFTSDVTKLRDKLAASPIVTADETEGLRNSTLAPPSGREGGELRVDAQGNKAFVFPDGSFEEVQ